MRFTFDERKSIERIFCVQRSYFFCSSNVKRIRHNKLLWKSGEGEGNLNLTNP